MERHFKGPKTKLCYEAPYVGYCLQRDLISNGVHCEIVSPSSIPSPRGKAIKTDRIDAGYLAQFYANDLLTIVQPPDEEQEQDRDLLSASESHATAKPAAQAPAHGSGVGPAQPVDVDNAD